MMLRSLGLQRESDAIEGAVARTLDAGLRTYDIHRDRPGEIRVGTLAMAQAVRDNAMRILDAV